MKHVGRRLLLPQRGSVIRAGMLKRNGSFDLSSAPVIIEHSFDSLLIGSQILNILQFARQVS